ncbi:hypothetical protein DPEC_G00117480 [Dallia pectoralis]|uniref:Uncharacterized protein n=1 Tax=Dallia pectoralis TaxID=75939 RepID=A0ACC2GUU0_DALPE|nr:hypothetical protein DPEC_G00117480 [Dallia pectoralis]
MKTCHYNTFEPTATHITPGVSTSSNHYTNPKGHVRSRRQREFIPEEKKDGKYWFKRKRNNEAAKRSRQRRRMEGIVLEGRAVELFRENKKLKATLSAVHYGALGNPDTISNPNHWFHHTVPGASPWTRSFAANCDVSKAVLDNPCTSVPGLPHNPAVHRKTRPSSFDAYKALEKSKAPPPGWRYRC